ncbi:hypothetical protein [Halomonas sp. WWR20]
MKPKKWDLWIILVWVLASISALCATFIILRYGTLKLPSGTGGAYARNGYNYFIIIGLAGLAVTIVLLAIISSMINDDFKSAISLYHKLKRDSESSRTAADRSADTQKADTKLALRVLRMSYNSPLRGHISEKAVIYNINHQHVTTAAEANRALVKGPNEILWKNSQGKLQTSTIEINDNDLRAHFEQRYRPD